MKSATALIATLVLFGAAGSGVMQAQGRGNGQANKPQTPAHTTGKPAATPPSSSAPKEHGNPHTKAATTTTTTTTTTITTTTPTTVKNPQLEQRLQTLLPGMNVADAAKGFKNWGQFMAAVHVSNNLNIPFASLKAKMTGPTPMSLGQAIQSLRPAGTTTVKTTTVTTEVHKAESEADEDIRVARNEHGR